MHDITVVLLANGLTVGFIYALWYASKFERAGNDAKNLPWRVILLGLLAPSVAALGAWLTF